MTQTWHDLGPVASLQDPPLREIKIGPLRIALSYVGGQFGAVGGRCPHAGGPLGEGSLKGESIVCPWHFFHYNRMTGLCRLGESFEIAVPSYELKIENGRLFLNPEPSTK